MTTAIATFGRVLTAMVTPFDADGSLDLDGAVKLATYLTTEGGNDGLIIAGTTGESPTLTHDEQIELIGAVAEAIDGPWSGCGTHAGSMPRASRASRSRSTVRACQKKRLLPFTRS